MVDELVRVLRGILENRGRPASRSREWPSQRVEADRHLVAGNVGWPSSAAGNSATAPPAIPSGGGIVINQARCRLTNRFAVEADLKLGRSADGTLYEVSFRPSPTSAPTVRPAPRAGLERSRQAQQDPLQWARAVNSLGQAPRKELARAGETKLRVVVSRDMAVVECDGPTVWAGLHGLPAISAGMWAFVSSVPRRHTSVVSASQ